MSPGETVQNNDKPKRRQKQGLACAECRRRKLRCDGKKPNCGTCSVAGIACEQITASAPRGPKKGHMKALQMRMAQIEARLQEQMKSTTAPAESVDYGFPETQINGETAIYEFSELSTPPSTTNGGVSSILPDPSTDMNLNILPTMNYNLDPELLSDLVRADLDQIYFERGHSFAPILQRRRYFAWANQPNKTEAQTALQYAMWALASYFSAQLEYLRISLREAAVRIVNELESRHNLAYSVEIEHAQARVILLIHDFLKSSFDVAWIGAGTCFRLLQYMRLYHIDSPSMASERFTRPEKEDKIRTEEMRRTFWVAYSIDRFANLRVERPLEFQETMISVRLPVPEDQFQSGSCPNQALLSECMASFSSQGFCPFSESIIIATACGRAIQHKQHALLGNSYLPSTFWDRHFWIEELLKARSHALGLNISQNPMEDDSLLIFVKMASRCTMLNLRMVLDSQTWMSSENQDLVRTVKERSVQALQEIANLSDSLMHLSPFKIHPFTPLLLSLCADFFEQHRDDVKINEMAIQQIVHLLSGMASTNQLANDAFSKVFIASDLASTSDSVPSIII